MYAVPALECDASTTLIAPAGRFFGVTLLHVLPPSRVTWTRPVLLPTHITPPATGEIASAWIDPPAAGPLTVLPAANAFESSATPFGAARSGLTACHVRPPSLEAMTCCAAMYSVRLSIGEKPSGGAPPKRPSGPGWEGPPT